MYVSPDVDINLSHHMNPKYKVKNIRHGNINPTSIVKTLLPSFLGMITLFGVTDVSVALFEE